MSKSTAIVGVNALLGFQQTEHLCHGGVPFDLLLDQQAHPPHAIPHVEGMVECGVRGENGILRLLSVLSCLLASVHPNHGECHALHLDVASQHLLFLLKQQLAHSFSNDRHLPALIEVALIDVPTFHDDNGVDVLVHRNIPIDATCRGFHAVSHVVSPSPTSKLVSWRHGQQRRGILFQVFHVRGIQFNGPASRIALVGNAGRPAPHEGAVFDPVAHVLLHPFLKAIGGAYRDENHEQPPTNAQRTQERAERIAQEHLRKLQPWVSLQPLHSSRNASTGRMATARSAGPNPLANPTITSTPSANNAILWSTLGF